MHYRRRLNHLLYCLLLLLAASCGVKNYPVGKPYVYQNNIKVSGNLSKQERSDLETRLAAQLADSMKVTIRESFLFARQIISPPAFDTAAASETANNMKLLLNTMGYYRAASAYDYAIDTLGADGDKTQYRVKTNFQVNPGPIYRIDSIEYILYDSTKGTPNELRLQQLTNEYLKESFLQKGAPFTEAAVSAELDRLIRLYRNHGFYKISRDAFYADVDTFFRPLLNPNLDPFERILLLQEAQEKLKNPGMHVTLRYRPNMDTALLESFRIGKVHVYPEYRGENISSENYETETKDDITVHYKKNEFRPSFIRRHILLKKGTPYSVDAVGKNLDLLNSLSTWQVINMQTAEAKDTLGDQTTVPALDFTFLLTPARKYLFTSDLEATYNVFPNGNILATGGQLVGGGLNFSIRNRNWGREGVQASNTLRAGVELLAQNRFPLQGTELTYGNSFSIPKLLFLPKTWKDALNAANRRSFINTQVSLINRVGFFQTVNVGTTLGYEFRDKKNRNWIIRPINIEYLNFLQQTEAFKDTLLNNPFLKFAFNQGLVVGTAFGFNTLLKSKKPKTTQSLRIGVEESGLILGRLKNAVPLFRKQLFEYVRMDAEWKKNIGYTTDKTQWAFRVIAGAGYSFRASGSDSLFMPFFKQYTGGGPNSMRAWPLRSIGPGSLAPAQPRNRNQFFSQTGDMLFEANAEFRYTIATLLPGTLTLRGAFFVDAGNIWNINRRTSGLDRSLFSLNNFYQDLSVSGGTGFRFDFNYFLLRFDFGLRLKKPYIEENAGWQWPGLRLADLIGRKEENRLWRNNNFNFSLGINYPF